MRLGLPAPRASGSRRVALAPYPCGVRDFGGLYTTVPTFCLAVHPHDGRLASSRCRETGLPVFAATNAAGVHHPGVFPRGTNHEP
jgi:hypothetical protein